jgi:hypothetical protein
VTSMTAGARRAWSYVKLLGISHVLGRLLRHPDKQSEKGRGEEKATSRVAQITRSGSGRKFGTDMYIESRLFRFIHYHYVETR